MGFIRYYLFFLLSPMLLQSQATAKLIPQFFSSQEYVKFDQHFQDAAYEASLDDLKSLSTLYSSQSKESEAATIDMLIKTLKIDVLVNLNKDLDSLMLILNGYLEQPLLEFERAKIYNTIGQIYYENYESNKAYEAFVKADSIWSLSGFDNILIVQDNKVEMANALLDLREYEKGYEIYNEVLVWLKENGNDDCFRIALMYYHIGRSYERRRDYENNLLYWQKAESLAEECLPVNHDLLLRIYLALGIYNNKNGSYKQSLKYCTKSYDGRKAKKNPPLKLLHVLRTRAHAYRRLDKAWESQRDLDEGIAIMEVENNFNKICRFLNDKASTTNSPSERISLYKKAINFCPEDPACSEGSLALMYANISIPYEEIGDNHSALNYLLKSKQIRESDPNRYGLSLSHTYNGLMTVYENLKRNDLAAEYSRKCLEAARKYNSHNKQRIAFILANHGFALTKEKRYKEAHEALNEAEQIAIQSETINQAYLANIYGQKSYLLEEQGDIEGSIEYIKKCIAAYEKSHSKRSLAYLDEIYNYANTLMLANRHKECEALIPNLILNSGLSIDDSNKYKIDLVPQAYYWAAVLSYYRALVLEAKLNLLDPELLNNRISVGVELIDLMRRGFYCVAAEVEFQEFVEEFFGWAYQQIYKQYQKSKDPKWLELFFMCVEKSKSTSTSRFYDLHSKAMDELIPLEVSLREKQLINEYEKRLEIYTYALEENNSDLADSLGIEMFKFQKLKENYIDSLKINFPKYHLGRYQPDIINLDKARDIAQRRNCAFINYVSNDSSFYSFLITPQGIQLDEISRPQLESNLDSFERLIQTTASLSSESDFLTDLENYQQAANELYQQLLPKGIGEYDKLVVMPTSKLTRLPFDILVDTMRSSPNAFKDLSYLINKIEVLYVSSFSKYDLILNSKYDDRTYKYLGFAPSYDNAADRNYYNVRGSQPIAPLYFNKDEVFTVAEMFEGSYFIDSTATDLNFFDKAPKAEVLHLAMHAVVNDEVPLESYLVFSHKDSSQQFSPLKSFEIANLNLSNKLVVLSACETNKGKLSKGDGILGIARAFNLALCPNLVLSNWTVDDQSSSKLMLDFFQNLKNGKNPASSLRIAKLNFLANASNINAHPLYWAGFSYYGSDNITIDYGSSSFFSLKSVLSFALILFLGLYLLKKLL